MAADTIDEACQHLASTQTCRTAEQLLAGAEAYDPLAWKTWTTQFDLDADTCEHLSLKYGSRAMQVLELLGKNAAWKTRLHPDYPFIQAEVIYQARAEMAVHPRDVLARRLRLEVLDWVATKEVTPLVAQLLGQELGWSAEQVQNAASAYQGLIATFQSKV